MNNRDPIIEVNPIKNHYSRKNKDSFLACWEHLPKKQKISLTTQWKKSIKLSKQANQNLPWNKKSHKFRLLNRISLLC